MTLTMTVMENMESTQSMGNMGSMKNTADTIVTSGGIRRSHELVS